MNGSGMRVIGLCLGHLLRMFQLAIVVIYWFQKFKGTFDCEVFWFSDKIVNQLKIQNIQNGEQMNLFFKFIPFDDILFL